MPTNNSSIMVFSTGHNVCISVFIEKVERVSEVKVCACFSSWFGCSFFSVCVCVCVCVPAVAEGNSTCELKLNIELLFTHHCCRPRRAHHTHRMTADAYLKQHPYTHKHQHTHCQCACSRLSLCGQEILRETSWNRLTE